ncbi:MAG: GDP-L-fucose synthase [Lentimicrobiaceae bacterium]|nr:GDP-L-fucose synthase [Lentimicrobiaceae bacterium]
METNSRIYVAGHTGLVGSAIVRNLNKKGYNNIVTRTHAMLDLMDTQAVSAFFEKVKPEYVFLAAAKVGGIKANNTYRAQFIFENLQIQNNVIHQAYLHQVKKLLFLGSSCVYPKNAPQPIREEYLLTGELEYTNEPYAIAKIAGMRMCESYNLQYGTDFISVMPTNLYGHNDNYSLENSHVLPAMIRKIHLCRAMENGKINEVKQDLLRHQTPGIDNNSTEDDVLQYLHLHGIRVEKQNGKFQVSIQLWGSGNPFREFLWSDDMADACVYLMEKYSFKNMSNNPDGTNNGNVRNTHINIGTGSDITIRELAQLVKKVVGFTGDIYFDATHPDGTFRKLLDVSRLTQLGWKYSMPLEEGIRQAYHYYLNPQD